MRPDHKTRLCLVGLTALAALGSACHPRVRPAEASVARADDEVELAVYVEPLASSPLSFELGGVAARRADGAVIPLALRLRFLSSASAGRQRLVAAGRLPPGAYAGLVLDVRRASLLAPGGTSADLTVPDRPLPVDAPFEVRAGTGQVLLLLVRPDRAGETALGEAVFAAHPPDRPSAPLLGVCAVDFAEALAVFDRRARNVVALFPTGPAPRAVAVDGGRQRAYVASVEADRIDAFDLVTFERLDPARLRAGDRPGSMALSPDGRVLLTANAGSDTVSLVDVLGAEEVQRLHVPGEPSWVTLDRTGRRAYVASRLGATVAVIDPAGAEVLGTFAVEPQPVRLLVDPLGDRLTVAYAAAPHVTVHALPGGALVGRIFTGARVQALLRDPRSGLLVLATADGRLQLYDPGTLLAVGDVALPAPAAHLVIDDAENALLAVMPARGAIAVIDLTARRLRHELELGPGPHDVALVEERR